MHSAEGFVAVVYLFSSAMLCNLSQRREWVLASELGFECLIACELSQCFEQTDVRVSRTIFRISFAITEFEKLW